MLACSASLPASTVPRCVHLLGIATDAVNQNCQADAINANSLTQRYEPKCPYEILPRQKSQIVLGSVPDLQ